MATPIAHSLFGITLYVLFTQKAIQLKEWKWLLFAPLLASLADFDFIPGLFMGDYNSFHRGVSHSIGVTLIISLLLWLVLRKGCSFSGWKCFLFLFCLYGSHLVIDFFTRDTWAPHGAQFLWPFSSDYFKSPVDLFLDANRTPWTRVFSLHNLITYLSECVLFGTPLYYFSKWFGKKEYNSST